jgi:hypothetical protein
MALLKIFEDEIEVPNCLKIGAKSTALNKKQTKIWYKCVYMLNAQSLIDMLCAKIA